MRLTMYMLFSLKNELLDSLIVIKVEKNVF